MGARHIVVPDPDPVPMVGRGLVGPFGYGPAGCMDVPSAVTPPWIPAPAGKTREVPRIFLLSSATVSDPSAALGMTSRLNPRVQFRATRDDTMRKPGMARYGVRNNMQGNGIAMT